MVDQDRKAEEDFDKNRHRSVKAMEYLGGALDGFGKFEIEPTGFSVRAPTRENNEFLCVLRGLAADGTPMVAFHAAGSLVECLGGTGARLKNGSLSWRVDTYKQ